MRTFCFINFMIVSILLFAGDSIYGNESNSLPKKQLGYTSYFYYLNVYNDSNIPFYIYLEGTKSDWGKTFSQ